MKKVACAKCGGAMKKMAKGGTMKTTVGKATPKGQIYGIPQTGPTGPNYQGINTMKKGGMVKKKYQVGGTSTMQPDKMYTNTTPGQIAGDRMKKGGSIKKMAKGGSFGMLSVKAGVDKNPKPTAADRIAGAKMKKMAVGGKTQDCPKGQVFDGTRCISNISSKIAAGILGTGVAALGTKIGMNIKENKPVRQAKRAAKKNSDLIAKRGGAVAKRTITKRK